MLISMTGFGRGEAVNDGNGGGLAVVAEIRSVNSRFLETSVRLPRTMSEREFEVRELVRKGLERGKISVNINITRGDAASTVPLTVNESTAKGYYELLEQLRTVTGMKSEITLRDLTGFSDIFTNDSANNKLAEQEWALTQEAMQKALDSLRDMRKQEGSELEKDLRQRAANLEDRVTKVEALSKNAAAEEYAKVKNRVIELTKDTNVINNERLELEVALLAERLDITEEIVRFRSHIKFFYEALDASEPAGRKLNFLLQEMNREVNTMGSKTSNPEVSHLAVSAKEELEKIREQVQNIE